MPIVIPNTTTQDEYAPETTFGGNQVVVGGAFTVANNPVYAKLKAGSGQGQGADFAELYLPPGTYPISRGGTMSFMGVAFKSFIPGSPAQVFGALWYPDEPRIEASSEFSTQVTPSGGVSPGGGGVVLGFQEQVANLTVTATTPATAQTAVSVTVDLATLDPIYVEYSCPIAVTGASTRLAISLWEGGTDLGLMADFGSTGFGSAFSDTIDRTVRITPAATGTITYTIKAYLIAGVNASLLNTDNGGAGVALPAFVKIFS